MMSQANTPKFTVSGNASNPTLMSTLVSASASASNGVITSASASAMIDLSMSQKGNLQGPVFTPNGTPLNDLRINSQMTTSFMVHTTALTQFVAAAAEARDPITVGADGFGGSDASANGSFSMEFDLVMGMVPVASDYTAEGVMTDGAVSNPDALFDPPEHFFTLFVDHSGGTRNIIFTPGTSPSGKFMNFMYTDPMSGMTLSPMDIQTRTGMFLDGMGSGSLFKATFSTNPMMHFTDVTLGGRDVLQFVTPEPATGVLALVGGALLAAAIGRRKRQLNRS